MANEATNDTTSTRGHVSKMQSGLELLAQIKLRENGSVEEFLTDIRPILRAFRNEKNEYKYKKPVNKMNNECYRFEIGKLGTGVVKSPSDGAEILDKLISAALDDNDTAFRACIENAYQLNAKPPGPMPAGPKPPGPMPAGPMPEGPRDRSRTPERRLP